SYMQNATSSTSDATSTSQYVAVTNAINAINTANTKYTSLITKLNEGQDFYNNRGGLTGWGGILKHEPELVTALQTALANANNWILGTSNTGTVETHIAEIQTAIDALNAASAKYATAAYKPTLTINAPLLLGLSGSTFTETNITVTSTYELSSGGITAPNCTLTYVSTTESGSGADKVWIYTFSFTGTVADPTTDGTVTFTATGTANGQESTATATSSYFGTTVLTYDLEGHAHHTYKKYSTTAYLNAETLISGLHYLPNGEGYSHWTGYHDSNADYWIGAWSYNYGTIGYFYVDKNTSNTLNTQFTSNISFATRGWYSDGAGILNLKLNSASADKTNFFTALSSPVNIYNTTHTMYNNNVTTLNVDSEGKETVTYTFVPYVHVSGDKWVYLDMYEIFSIDYYQVDTTKLWNLYNSEANILKRLDYEAFYKANDSATWEAYKLAYVNAMRVLQGGVSQETIDNAYNTLCQAIVGLKGKMNYNLNGGTGSVTTPVYVPIYSAVETSTSGAVTYTEAIVELASYSGLTRSGFTCTGWANDASKTTTDYPSNKLTMFATSTRWYQEFTIYAAWAPFSYTVKYNANAPSGTTATGSVASQTCNYNTTYKAQANSFVVTNYKFTGWNTKADGSGTTYAAGASFKNLSSTNGATVNLYAMWEADTVNITLNRNRSKDGIEIEVLTGPTETKAYAFTIGSTVDLTQYKMTAVGYEHLGWATNASATTPNYTTTFTVPNTAQTLHAVWQKKSISVSYTLYDGVLSGSGYTIAGTTVEYQGTVNLPDADQITRTGCVFTGWHASVADANGKTFFEPGVNYVVPDATGTITFTANWVLRTTTYTFHHNNVPGSDYTTTISGQYGSALTESFPTPSAMTGYTFIGWYVKDGTGYKAYTKPSTYPESDVELYAGWSMDALQSAINSIPYDIEGVYHPTGEYYYQETGRLNVLDKRATAQNIIDTTDGVVYTYDQLIPANTATSELLHAIDSLIETPAHYDTVNEYLKKYNELLDGSHEYSGVFVNKDFFTSESFAEFEKSVEAVVNGKGIKNQAEVDAYAAALKATYEALQLMGADYSKFNFFVEEALRLNKDLGSGETTLEYIQENTEAVLWYEFGLWEEFFTLVGTYKTELDSAGELTKLEQGMIDDFVEVLSQYWPLPLKSADFSEYYNNGYGDLAAEYYQSSHKYDADYRRELLDMKNAIEEADTNKIYTFRDDQDIVNKMISDLVEKLNNPVFMQYTITFYLDSTNIVYETVSVSCEDTIQNRAPKEPTRKGYIFLGWYTTPEATADEPGTKIDFAEITEQMGYGNREYWARWSSAFTLDVSSVGGYVYITVGDTEEKLYEYRYVNDNVVYGTNVTLRAVSDTQGREFLYWKDNRHRIVSYSEVFEFTLEADRILTAVYSEPSDTGYYTVVFVDSILKTVLDEQGVEANGSAVAPNVESAHGEYVFSNWNKSFDKVTGNLIVEAVYVLGENLFTITTNINGKETKQTYKYNSPVTITIAETDIPEGKVFAGWSLNGKDIVSYSATYKFYAYKDMTVTAIFSTAAVEAEATVTLTTAVKDETGTTYKAEFMVTREIPDDYVFVSSGLLLTQSSNYSTNETLTFETQSNNTSLIRLYRTVHTDNDGQYMLTVKTSSGKTFYARG
ncbi:MAG: InlB B-repeat-containing protein, partial [Clostridia bacterium]|nr:InlB B-repeat-containing protein [Clostridia bacterium]